MSRAGFRAAANNDEHKLEIVARISTIARNDHVIAGSWLTFALLYATLRYNVYKHVPWADWPTYVVNKAFGVSSLILLALTAFRWSKGNLPGKTLMLWSGSLTGAHVVLSLILLDPEYYPKFFDGSKFNTLAAFSILFGTIAVALQELGARKAKDWQPTAKQRVLSLLAFFIGVHAVLPGIKGWFAPATWPGGLPPITLISAAIASVAAGSMIFSTKTRRV